MSPMSGCLLQGFSSSERWRPMRRALTVIAPLVVFFSGLGVRRFVLEAQKREWGQDLPFTLESAIHFRRVKLFFEAGRLPVGDAWVGYPEGVNVRETYTTGDERLYAILAKLFPSRMSLQERVRWIEAAWFCMGAVCLGWWLARHLNNAWAGWGAAWLYAVSPAAVVRSTGQELSHENTALPLLIAHLALYSLSYQASGARRAALVLGSALFLAWAVCWWDLVLFYVLIWGVFWSVRILAGKATRGEMLSWVFHVLVLSVAGLVNPYHRAHGLAVSPVLLWFYGVILGQFLEAAVRKGWIREAWSQPRTRMILTALPLVVGLLAGGAFRESYGHFMALLWAKLRFLNVKPPDPALLTFEQRILWVPGLNSASWRLTRALFPGMLWVSLVLVPFWARRSELRSNPETGQFLWFLCASLVAFAFFARMHVFTVVFAAIVMAWGLAHTLGRRTTLWPLGSGVVMALVAMEAAGVVLKPERWGRTGVYYDELREMTEWLRAHVSPDPVLANFGVSGSILAYGECPVVLHPKFESTRARERVRQYGEHMFLGTERSLRDWASRHGAEYLVYSMGEFASVGREQQMRYMVNALDPPSYAPARRFEFAPDECRYFKLLWSNTKYRVFDILTWDDERQSAAYAREARRALERGDLEAAGYAATQALLIHPGAAEAQQVMKHVMVLREQDFNVRPNQQ